MTLHGEKKEIIQKDVNTIHRLLRNVLVNPITAIGLSWSFDQKRHGTDLTLINPTDLGTKVQRA